MATSLRAFFNRYIPASIKEKGDLETILRARVLTGLFFSNMVIALLVLAVFTLVTFFADIDIILGMIAIGIAIVFLVFEIYLFYSFANVAISAIIFSMTFFSLTLAAVIVTGGWFSPILFLFFCAPAISFLVGGKSEGLYMSSLILVCGGALYAANLIGFEVFQIIKTENTEIVRSVVWIVSVNTLASCFAVYDSLLRSVTRILEQRA